jgi:lipopolysaccharide biosynthesis glycosyltransferase
MPLAATISSALRGLRADFAVRLMVVDGGMSSTSRMRLERVVTTARPDAELEWHPIDLSRFANAKVSDWGSSANYLRLLVPELALDSTRVIYLDSDVIVRHDLAELWEVGQQPTDCAAFAVINFTYSDAAAAFGNDGALTLQLKPETAYFNSGVLVINVPVWRSERVSERALDVAERFKQLMRFSDQDALNIVLAGEWVRLDERWNVMLNYLHRYTAKDRSDRENARRQHQLKVEGFIDHYGGHKKPWSPGYFGKKGRTYRRTLYRSGWFDDRRETLIWTIRFWLDPRWATAIKPLMAKRFTKLYRRLRHAKRIES